MKKLIFAWGLLLAFLLGGYFIPSSSSTTTSHTTTSKHVKVGILQLMSHPALNQIRKGIIAGLKQSGYVVGKNLTIDYQNAQNDQSNLTSMSQRFASENVNVAVGIATTAAQTLANTFSSTPVVMAGISDPVGSHLVKSLTKPQTNVTGTRHQEPILKQLQLVKRLTPNVHTIGVMYTASDDSSSEAAQTFIKAAKRAGYTVKRYTIASTNDITQTATSAASEVQALYVPTDNTIASGLQALLKVTNSQKIPVYAGSETMVQQGAFATIGVSQYEMGVETGKMVAQILKGKNPATMAVKTTTKVSYALNTTNAKKLGISISNANMKLFKNQGVIYQWTK